MNKELNDIQILDCTLRVVDIIELEYLSNNIEEFGIYYNLNKTCLSKAKKKYNQIT